MAISSHKIIVFSLLIFLLYIHCVRVQYVSIAFSDDDFHDGFENDSTDEYTDSDEFMETEFNSKHELEPGSWHPIFEQEDSTVDAALTQYYSRLQKILSAASEGNTKLMEEAITELDASASAGDPHAQSMMGFMYGIGMTRETSGNKSFLLHQFAAEGGNMQSKMAIAFRYIQLDLYAEVAHTTVKSFLISKDYPINPIRIHSGIDEDKDLLKRFRGEDNEDSKILKSQAEIGNSSAMYKIRLYYYLGMRGLRSVHVKAIYWFSKAVEKRELNSMVILGEIYVRGASVERNYTKAFEFLTLAAEQGLYLAFNGLGYLYVKGYGVEKRNYTKAREYFEKAAENEDVNGIYYLGMLYLKGFGVKRDVKQATKYFILAANAGLPKAIYQLAKMTHAATRLKKNVNTLKMVTIFRTMNAKRLSFKIVFCLTSYFKSSKYK